MEETTTKLVLLGRGGVGKTTLRKIFFDRESPLVLIKDNLTPTLGAEVNSYNLGLNIAVHDLAGQELNHWLTDGSGALDLSDIILVVLECSDDWDENLQIIKQVQQIQSKNVPSAVIIAFFHKIDLLTSLQLDTLKARINEFRENNDLNVKIFLTSIQEKHILETFWAFIQSLKLGMCRKNNTNFRDYILKLELLRYFTKNSKADLNVLEKDLKIKREYIQWYLHQLFGDGTLDLEPNSEVVTIGKKGIATLNTLKYALNPKTKEILLSERDYIKGVILSDKTGIPFYTYEEVPGFFNTLVVDERTSSEPGIISMFFAQIVEFGKTMDYNGLTNFQFGGHNLKIASLLSKGVLAIFFVDRIQIDQGSMKILEEFLKSVFTNYGDSIYNYFVSNNPLDIARLSRNLKDDIESLDVILKSHHQNKSEFTKEKLLEMYLNLTEEKMDKISSRDMKSLLFQYLIMESPDTLKEI
ncbi:hypothetical protein DSAG12_02993 [Promethearchaeum syntrophicum]|uniref:Uncharacterized protein n=1 Tax=Promethearchaeum syntrophicum TaxID=2594042 RepID=A0A5B9DDT9_9ARCH|nr:hypothetical protein [Candidatus Prometheoarchaeum syntrophicum]